MKDFTQDLAADLERVALLLRNTNVIHDPLTGLASAAYLEERLREEAARGLRMQIPFGLVAVTVYGQVGAATGLSDSAIRETAALLKANLRAMDVVARIGRLEFLCLIPEAGAAEAALVADRLTAVVGANSEQLAGVRLVAGAASFPADGGDAEALITAARLALLRVRTAGASRRPSGDLPAPPVHAVDQAATLRSVAQAAQRQPKRKQQVDFDRAPAAKNGSANQASETPVAVGYVSGARFPVSYWHGNDMVSIKAVLEEHAGESETRLLTQTDKGMAELVCRGRRWYLVRT